MDQHIASIDRAFDDEFIDRSGRKGKWYLLVALISMAILVGLYYLGRHNYLLFHSFAEGFSIIIAFTTFSIAWNSRRFMDNDYLLFIGISYLFVGSIDFLHTLAYKGMGVFPNYDTNPATQLWIAARYVGSLSLLIAPWLIHHKLRVRATFLVYALATGLIISMILQWKVFPTAFVEGDGLTTFKVASEYVISAILVSAIWLLYRNRQELAPTVWILLVCSMATTIASEMAFTLYSDAYGIANMAGHILKIVSFYLVYKALIETGLTAPYKLLFRNLKRSEEKYRMLFSSMTEGFALHKIILDSTGKPVNYRFIELNDAFENLTGLLHHDVIGKTVKEVLPDIEPFWIETYGKVALTGESTHFENFSAPLGKWYQVHVYSPQKHYFAVLFFDMTERKQMEASLSNEKELLKAVMANTHTLLAYLDTDFNFISANASYAQNCGCTEVQLIGRNHFDICSDEEKKMIFQSVLDTGKAVYFQDYPFEFPADSDQSTRYWNWTLAPVKDKSGTIMGLVLSLDETTDRVRAEQGLMDYQKLLETRVSQRTEELAKAIEALKKEVAERKRAERDIRESERRYRELAERSLDGFARIDMEGRVFEWNAAFRNMLGYSNEELKGIEYRDLTPNIWEDLEQEMMAHAVAEGYSPVWQEEYLRKDGTVFPVELQIYLMHDNKGNPSGMWTFVRDITERVRAQQELEKTQARLLEAQRIAHLGHWEWDIQEDIAWRSDEVYRIFGISSKNIEPNYDGFAKFVHPEDRSRVNSIVETAIHNGQSYSIDYRIVRPDGIERDIFAQGIVICNKQGKPIQMKGTLWDVTELKDTERRLRTLSQRLLQVQEQERQMIGRDLHDQLGQSLTVLTLLLNQAIQSDPKEVHNVLGKAMDVTKEIAVQIREISSELRPRILDDLGLLPALIWQVHRINDQSSVQVEFKHSGLNRKFSADVSTTVYRIVQEALTNIVRYAKADKAEIHVQVTENHLMIDVEDNGVGFDAGTISNESYSGISGMDERVRLINGEFSVESSPGYGTRVRAVIPLF